MDLRQRRRLETTKLIHKAAVALAHENGPYGVTIEAICQEAGISQRSFFNYFPFKEAAFVFSPPPLAPEAVAHFLNAEGDMMGDLIDLMVAQAIETSKAPWVGGLMREIAVAHPKVIPLQMAEFHKSELELEALIVKRLGTTKDDIRCAALAGAFAGVSRTAHGRWHEDVRADLPALVRESLEGLITIVRSTKLS